MKSSKSTGEIIYYNEEEYLNEGKNDKGLFILRNQRNRSKILYVDDETLRNMKIGDKRNITSIMQSQRSLEDEDLIDSDPASTSTEDINQSDVSASSQSENNLEDSVRTSLDNHQTLKRLLDEGEKVAC